MLDYIFIFINILFDMFYYMFICIYVMAKARSLNSSQFGKEFWPKPYEQCILGIGRTISKVIENRWLIFDFRQAEMMWTWQERTFYALTIMFYLSGELLAPVTYSDMYQNKSQMQEFHVKSTQKSGIFNSTLSELDKIQFIRCTNRKMNKSRVFSPYCYQFFKYLSLKLVKFQQFLLYKIAS